MKTIDTILLETHGSRDFNYNNIRQAMVIQHNESRKPLFELIFKGKQKEIWEALDSRFKSTGEIAINIKMPSKNVNKQLSQMVQTGLIRFYKKGRLIYWNKIN